MIRKLLNAVAGSSASRAWQGKPGARAYAVGDVHGCDKLLSQLLDVIEEDLLRHPVGESFLVFLGDLIDRGPASADVLERLRSYSLPGVRTVFLSGNHEEFFLRVLAGERGVLDSWLDYGGKQCALSYGVDLDQLVALPEDQAIAMLRRHVPDAHRRFLEGFGDSFRFGDYVFVHAGIRPGVSLEQQSRSDLRWIRSPFLDYPGNHGFMVVHGHTIVEEVEERSNRIGLDTGAYRTGKLTALVVEGAERRLLSACEDRRGEPASFPARASEASW